MRRRSATGVLPPAASAIVVIGLAVAVGLLIVLFRDHIFPARFDFDAEKIRRLIDFPVALDAEQLGSFSDIAAFYEAVGIGGDRLLAGFLGFGALLAGIALAIWRGGGVPDSVQISAVLGAGIIIGTAFLGTHTKEVLVALLVAIVLLLPSGWFWELLVVAACVGFGMEYRSYWMLIAAGYVVFRLYLTLRRGTRGMFPAAPLLVAGFGFVLWLAMGVAPDHYRVSVNEVRLDGADAQTMIGRLVSWPEPIGGIVNNVSTFVFLLLPLPMLALGTAYHAVLAVVIFALWATFAWATAAFREEGIPPMTARAIALVMAFVSVQALFEPDYGSALKHLTPMLPLIVLILITAARRRAAEAAGEAAAPQASDPDPPGAAVRGPDPSAHDPGPPGSPHRPASTTTDDTTTRQDTTMTQKRTAASGGNEAVGRIISALSRYAWVLFAAAVVGAIAGWAGSQFLTKQYSSSAELFVTASTESEGTTMYQQSMFFEQRLASYAQLVDDDAVLRPVIDELNLDETPRELAKRISAAPTPETVLLKITAVDEDPRQAARLAEVASATLVDVVGDLDYTTSSTTSSGGYDENGTWREPGTEETRTPVSTMTVVSAPEVPNEPSSPNVMRNTVLGAIAGLILAALGIAIAVLRDTTVKRRRDLEEASSAPVLATIPSSRVLEDGHLPDYATEGSGAAESFRGLRTNLRFVDVDNPPKLIAITSAKQGEGKTTTTLNLASALAAEGHRVCVVDGDLRRPRIARALGAGIEEAVGLSTVLAGDCTVEDAVQHHSERGFDVVASGPIPPNPAELIASKACRTLLRELGDEYDYVIVDAAPLLPVTDGALLASAAEGAIVVARYGKVRKDEFADAIGALEGANAHVIGTILNQSAGEASDAYRYGGYRQDAKK
ncbi:polysaccharide biosynthesis tyrosine autokinase [Corynebacterium sp. 335C]